MSKVATTYLEVHPWLVIEKGYHEERTLVSESIFSLANEYQGVRGFFDEGGNIPTLRGTYFNGVYEYAKEDTPISYKGIIKRTHFMINSVDYLKTMIKINGQILDLKSSTVNNFIRELDLRSGLLTREFDWIINNNLSVKIRFERFLSMNDCTRAFQRITIIPTSSCQCDFKLSLDSNVIHWGKDCYWNGLTNYQNDDVIGIMNETLTTKQRLLSLMKVDINKDTNKKIEFSDMRVDLECAVNLNANEELVITRYVSNIVEKDPSIDIDSIFNKGLKDVLESFILGFEKQLDSNIKYWDNIWNKSDIEIVGDDLNQQGIRYCIFQLEQTYHGYSSTNNIGAKGLTGEAYSGHAFWDTETYCLPYYLFNNLEAAKNLLMYRYNTLPQARLRAKELDCDGACYPIATLNGYEACNLWQHASLQIQPTTAVAYAIYHYVNFTKDVDFLLKYGLEMLLEISKFLLSRGQWNPSHTHFSYYCVMGPDEFQMMVNHNTYTNYMAKRTFDYTLELISKYKDTKECQRALRLTKTDDKMLESYKNASEKMYILYNEKTKLFEQHDGYFDLPHIDIKTIPVTDFPLYSHWSYDRIYRNDIIKQPDVLMFLFLYNQSFSLDIKKANYEFYEPRCIHESSLSPSIHSILASELGKDEEALKFFGFSTRMDLDDYNRNTNEGLHLTSIFAAWVTIVYGFGGLRSDGEILTLNPRLPSIWEKYSFNITYQGAKLKFLIYKEGVEVINQTKIPIKLKIYNKEYEIVDNLNLKGEL